MWNCVSLKETKRAFPSKGFFGKPLHQRGAVGEDELAAIMEKRKVAWEKQNPDQGPEHKPNFRVPQGQEWYDVSPETIKKRQEDIKFKKYLGINKFCMKMCKFVKNVL